MGGIIRAYNYVNKAVFDIILVNKEGGKIENFTFRR
jgi:hypothetical protein